jgi:hypothetical protein
MILRNDRREKVARAAQSETNEHRLMPYRIRIRIDHLAALEVRRIDDDFRFQIAELVDAVALEALLKIVPETLKYSDREGGPPRCLAQLCGQALPAAILRGLRFFALIDRADIPVHTHQRKSWTACPPPPLVISS